MLGIVIPVHGHWRYAIRALRSALNYTPHARAIVVDDASPWGSKYFERIVGIGPGRVSVQRFRRPGGLAKSWRVGLERCRWLGLEAAVLAHSDVVFAPGWWPPLQEGLSNQFMVGPLSNATSRSCQLVSRRISDYETDDTDQSIAKTETKLRLADFGLEPTNQLGGFCVAGKTDELLQCLASVEKGTVPNTPEANDSDLLIGRMLPSAAKLAVAVRSFVFHYGGVTRGRRDPGSLRNQTLPDILSLAPGDPTQAGRKKNSRPECLHLGRLIDPVIGRRSCRQRRWCEHFKKPILQCIDCETCLAYEEA